MLTENNTTDVAEPEHHSADVAFDVVVVAASMGGVAALSRVLADLPADFSLPMVVAQHLCADRPSLLAEVLDRRASIRVRPARHGVPLRPGTVFTPVPGEHVTIGSKGRLSVFSGPRIQFVRPSADLLFQSAVETFGARVIAVVLSGSGRDGAVGVQAVRGKGGFVVAEAETTCQCFDMPYAAIETRRVDLVLPVHHIGFALGVLSRTVVEKNSIGQNAFGQQL